jgi:uncharacterized protein YcbK (DUF882 family)
MMWDGGSVRGAGDKAQKNVISHGTGELEGEAIDIRIPGIPASELRDAALALHLGGVGFYPKSEFVHVDVGRVRQW